MSLTVHINLNDPVGVSANDDFGVSLDDTAIVGVEGRTGVDFNGSVSDEVGGVVQEAKQLERQQHMEEQHRLHISAGGLNQLNGTANGTAGVNATYHVDDFLARIDKLRQVGSYHQSVSLTQVSTSVQQCIACSPHYNYNTHHQHQRSLSCWTVKPESDVPANESSFYFVCCSYATGMCSLNACNIFLSKHSFYNCCI